MRDDAVAVFAEKRHLRVRGVGRWRRTMAEHERLAGAPILEENPRTIRGRDDADGMSPFWLDAPNGLGEAFRDHLICVFARVGVGACLPAPV